MNAVSKPVVLFVACLLSLAALASPPRSTGVFRKYQAKNLIGLKVENEDGILLGKVKNFVIDASSGQLVYALVSSGGGLTGIGSQTRALPASSLTPATAKRGVACVSINAKNWQRLPLYKKRELSRLADYDHYHSLFASVGLRFSPEFRDTPALSPTGRSKSQARTSSPSLTLVSDLFRDDVVDAQGQSLGEISDLLLDTSGGRPAVALVSNSHMLRNGQTFALPLNSFKTAGKNKFSANVFLDSVTSAPLLTPEIWGSRNSSGLEIYRFALK